MKQTTFLSLDESVESTSNLRHSTVIPPPPLSKDEISELISIELQLSSIPNLSAVHIDDIVALAMVHDADLIEAQLALKEMFELDSSSISSIDNVTMLPQSKRKAVNA